MKSPIIIGKRYRLEKELGTGAMGTVYRAVDKLNGEVVALKRLLIHPQALHFVSPHSDADLRLMMAREFQALASLHHPNIISVRDYGFDQDGQPFFTMEYLPDAQTIFQAGAQKNETAKLDLLVQMLRALAYLHRRGTIHRDLKPSNVLVSRGQVKVLDFGLAVPTGEHGGVSGSLPYVAPEVLEAAPASTAADLYAAGMLTYELFAGHHPFDTSDLSSLIDAILDEKPDLSPLPEPLAPVLERLLAKEPAQRYAKAEDVLQALSQSWSRPLPQETAETRESFLQAAQFVGRQDELGRLSDALEAVQTGQGSAWLVGGESGVGKSRLLHEVRTRALVRGALVLHGQAVSERGKPYHLWRDVARWLSVLAGPDDLEAGVLRLLLPDIDGLLDRPVPEAPQLEPQAEQTRLLAVMATLLRRSAADAPLLLLLEDLQWAEENSLTLLGWVNRLAAELPILVIGNYRDDERPDLPQTLPGMQLIKLHRLEEAAVAELSASMLGEAGESPQLVTFLQRETEGNTFFIVEVVRALAEEAGQLDKVGQLTLPTRVFAGGIRQVVQRRLSRAPSDAMPLLNLAAIAGRQIDRAVLAATAPQEEFDDFLATCANAAVLESLEGRWQFAHDKLRDGVLLALSPKQRQKLHHQIALAIEQTYAADLSPHLAELAHHFGQAEQPEQAIHYSLEAARQAQLIYANETALAWYQQSLELLTRLGPDQASYVQSAQLAIYQSLSELFILMGRYPEALAHGATARSLLQAEPLSEEQARQLANLYRQTADVYEKQGNYDLAAQWLEKGLDYLDPDTPSVELVRIYNLFGWTLLRHGDYETARLRLEQALNLARSLQAERRAGPMRQAEANCLRTLGVVFWRLGDYDQAQGYFEKALLIYQEIGDRQGESYALNNFGVIAFNLGEYARARKHYHQSLLICQEIGDRRGEGSLLGNLGVVARNQDDYEQALAYYEQALLIQQELGDRQSQALTLNNLGSISLSQGDYTQAETYHQQALLIRQAIGNRRGEGGSLSNLGNVYRHLGDYVRAQTYFEQALDLKKEIGDRAGESLTLTQLALLAHDLEQHRQARRYSHQALAIAQAIGNRANQASALTYLGHASVELGEVEKASQAYQEARELWRELGQTNRAMETLAGLASVAWAQGETAQALAWVEQILQHLETGSLDGAEGPFRIYTTCYRILHATRDRRADQILSDAQKLLQDRASKISDEALRRSFLHDVPAHRDLLTLWATQ